MGDKDKLISNSDIFKLLQSVADSNKEIKEDIKTIKEELSSQNQNIIELNKKVESLEIENKELHKSLEAAKNIIKKNNIVIFGIPDEQDTNIRGELHKLFKEQLEVEVFEEDIDNLYRVGAVRTDKPRPVILEFVRNTVKQQIFSNVRKLKGSGISISNDLTPEKRNQQRVLLKHLKAARLKNYNAKILKDKLIVDGITYSYEDLVETDKLDISHNNILLIPSGNRSAPETPTTRIPPTLDINKAEAVKNINCKLVAPGKENLLQKEKTEKENTTKRGRGTEDTLNLTPETSNTITTRSKQNRITPLIEASPPLKKSKN